MFSTWFIALLLGTNAKVLWELVDFDLKRLSSLRNPRLIPPPRPRASDAKGDARQNSISPSCCSSLGKRSLDNLDESAGPLRGLSRDLSREWLGVGEIQDTGILTVMCSEQMQPHPLGQDRNSCSCPGVVVVLSSLLWLEVFENHA